MPSVTWTKNATTVTFAKGITRGPHAFQDVRVVDDKLANGAIVTYDLGLGAIEVITCTFPHVTAALLASVLSFKDSTIKGRLVTFSHTDNSESPALVKTVRLLDFSYQPETYTDPANPRYTITAKLQVEPA